MTVLNNLFLPFFCSCVYKLTDFGAARELAPEQLFVSIYGTEEYLVIFTGILAVANFFIMDRIILKEFIFNMAKQKKFGKFFKDLSLEFIKKTSFKMSFLKKYQCLYQSINNTKARCPHLTLLSNLHLML